MKSIKINTAYNDRHTFEIVTELPKPGGSYNGEQVTEVSKLMLDPEQSSNKAQDYDCFSVTTKNESGEENCWNIAIDAAARVKMMPVIRILGRLLPSSKEANAVIRYWLANEGKSSQLANDLGGMCLDYDDEDTDILDECFGISSELYENTAVKVLDGSSHAYNDSASVYEKSMIDFELGQTITISGMVPYWWTDEETAVISLYEGDPCPDFEKRTVADIHPVVFNEIVENIREKNIHYEDGRVWSDYPSWYDLISPDLSNAAEIIKEIADLCLTDFGELRKRWGITQAEMKQSLCIPKRTIEDWCAGERKCRDYNKIMIAETLGKIKRRH